MNIEKFRQGQEIMTDILAKDLEEYHKLVNQKLETFTWKIFAGFLLSKGWTHKDRYLIWNPPECYSCGEEITMGQEAVERRKLRLSNLTQFKKEVK